MNLFTYDDYRKLLRDLIEEMKTSVPGFTASGVAKAIRVQKSYLSGVLKERAHLNSDQLFLAAEHLKLSKSGTSFLLLLLEIDRCQVPVRLEWLKSRRDRFRREFLRTEHALGKKPVLVADAALTEYFSTPICPVVHMLLTIPENLRNPSRIARKLGLSKEYLDEVLAVLERAGILTNSPDGYTLCNEALHLSSNSHLARSYAVGFRLKAIEYQQKRANPDDYFFSASVPGDERLRIEAQAKFLEFLQWLSSRTSNLRGEEVYQVNFDLFKY